MSGTDLASRGLASLHAVDSDPDAEPLRVSLLATEDEHRSRGLRIERLEQTVASLQTELTELRAAMRPLS